MKEENGRLSTTLHSRACDFDLRELAAQLNDKLSLPRCLTRVRVICSMHVILTIQTLFPENVCIGNMYENPQNY